MVEIINELTGEEKGEKVSPGHVVKAMILNGCGSFIAFRNLDFNESLTVFKSFVFFNSPGYENLGIQAAWVLIPLAIVHWAGYKGWFADWWRRIPGWSFAAWYGLSVTSILPFLAFDYQPFVYFQF